jgi:hypothetical protein
MIKGKAVFRVPVNAAGNFINNEFLWQISELSCTSTRIEEINTRRRLLPITLPTAVERCSKKQHNDICTSGELHNKIKSFKISISTSFPDSKAFNTVSSILKDEVDAIAAYTSPLEVIVPVPR